MSTRSHSDAKEMALVYALTALVVLAGFVGVVTVNVLGNLT